MRRASHELRLIIGLTEGIYGRPVIAQDKSVNWGSFFKLASLNHVLYHCVEKLIDGKCPSIPDQTAVERAVELKQAGDDHLDRLSTTLSTLRTILGDSSHLVFGTYRGYSYTPEDVDLLVRDLKEATNSFARAQISTVLPALSKHVFVARMSGCLEVEVYTKMCWGWLAYMDDELPWLNPRKADIEGIQVFLPSLEADLLAFLANLNFHSYSMPLGDLLYWYMTSPAADWQLMQEQAAKYGWLGALHRTVAILNGMHRSLYGEPAPAERHVPVVRQVQLEFPYVLSLSHAATALLTKDVTGVAKLPTYLSVRLKKRHPRLHAVYSKVVLESVGEMVERVIYR